MKKLLPKNNFSFVILVASVCMFSVVACSKKQQQQTAVPKVPPKPVAALPKPVQKQASTALRLSAPSVNQFDFSNKKDPFKPFVAVKAEPKNNPEALKKSLLAALPIHRFDVSQFKLIGVITGGRENQAMVTDPGGKGYVLKVGMLIGKNEGKVISISTQGVEILEQFKDDNGKIRKENIKLTLPRKQ